MPGYIALDLLLLGVIKIRQRILTLKDELQSILRNFSTLAYAYKHYNGSLDMECESMLFIANHRGTIILSLRPFTFSFQQLYWFLQLRSCFIRWLMRERSFDRFVSIMAVVLKLWSYCLHGLYAKMATFKLFVFKIASLTSFGITNSLQFFVSKTRLVRLF